MHFVVWDMFLLTVGGAVVVQSGLFSPEWLNGGRLVPDTLPPPPPPPLSSSLLLLIIKLDSRCSECTAIQVAVEI